MYSLSLHWVMKNMNYFNVSDKPDEGLLRNIEIANVFHHPVQTLNMNLNP